MVISFKDILSKKEIKPNVKIKINEYKKSLKNNFLSSEWIKSCIKNEEFVSYNLDKLSLREIALFNKNKNKSQSEFMTECRRFYKEDCIPEFLKLFYNEESIIEFFENYKDYLLNETLKNANIIKFLLSEMLCNLIENTSFEIQPNDFDAYLPNKKFKVTSFENEFFFEINKLNKTIILEKCSKNQYVEYFEKRNKNKELVKLFLKKEECKDLENLKRNALFLKKQYISYNEFYLKPSKNCFAIKCQLNEIVHGDKKAFCIFEDEILIHDLMEG
jgi:hypothetical protein